MQTINIRQAKTQLSPLIAKAVKSEPFIIAKAGKPQVLVTRVDASSGVKIRRLGFMVGQITIPDDFDQMGHHEIEAMFGNEE